MSKMSHHNFPEPKETSQNNFLIYYIWEAGRMFDIFAWKKDLMINWLSKQLATNNLLFNSFSQLQLCAKTFNLRITQTLLQMWVRSHTVIFICSVIPCFGFSFNCSMELLSRRVLSLLLGAELYNWHQSNNLICIVVQGLINFFNM